MHFPVVWRRLTGKRVLEIGCGTGRHTANLVRQGNEVVGIDLSPGMLAVARRTLEGHRVELIHADFMTFDGLAAGDFDAVVASWSWRTSRTQRSSSDGSRGHSGEAAPSTCPRSIPSGPQRVPGALRGSGNRPGAAPGELRAHRRRPRGLRAGSGASVDQEPRRGRRRGACEGRRRLAAAHRQADDQDLGPRAPKPFRPSCSAEERAAHATFSSVCQIPKTFPSGSFSHAYQPIPFTGVFGVTSSAPRRLAFRAYSSRFSTPM